MIRSRAMLVCVVAALVLAACGDDPDGDTGGQIADDADELRAIVEDLNDYWSEADEDLGFDYEEIPQSRVGTGGEISCDGETISEASVEGNAFVDPFCEEGITVVYDADYVSASLARAESTMAHEWGHVIQAQAGDIDLSRDPDGLDIDAELQADCLAGAWAAERAEADIERLRTDTEKAGDPGEVDIEDPHAHGTPEQRVAAFDVGLDGGPAACIDELIDALPQQ